MVTSRNNDFTCQILNTMLRKDITERDNINKTVTRYITKNYNLL